MRRGDAEIALQAPQRVAYWRGEKAKKPRGPYSTIIDRGALGTISGNTREGKFLRIYERLLIEHVGGNPSVTQRLLITRATRLALHLELLDERALKGPGGGLSATDQHFYCTWSNSLSRHLAKLGFEPAKPKTTKPTLNQIVTEAEIAEAAE